MGYDNTNFKVYSQTCTEHKYYLTYANINTFLQQIMNGAYSGWQATNNFFQNTSEFITSIIFYPFSIMHYFPQYTTNYKDAKIYIGNVLSNIDAIDLVLPLPTLELFSFSVTRRFNNFLDYAPYTKFTLLVPLFKSFELDPQVIYGKTIKGYLSVDFTSGDATLYIYADTVFIDSVRTKIGINVSIGRTNKGEMARNQTLIDLQTAINVVGSVAGMAGGAITGNAVLTVGSAINLGKTVTEGGLKSLQNAVLKLTNYQGSSGTRDTLPIDKEVYLIEEYPTVTYSPTPSLYGKPCAQYKTLSTLSGYTKVGNIHFNPSGADIYNDEINEIVTLLQAGVIL